MFVFNIKLNLKKFVKILFVIMAIIVSVLFLFSIYKIIRNSFKVKDDMTQNGIIYIEPENYTNMLKAVYENLDSYVGKEVSCSGYVYRCIDFSENQFVIARDMSISSTSNTLIVGFLCESKKIQKYEENSWVEIVGKIEKGNYHGEIPILKIKKIKKIERPKEDLVPPPDNTYIPTSSSIALF